MSPPGGDITPKSKTHRVMSSLCQVLHEMLLEALGHLHNVMWIWETLDPQRVWRDSLICGKKLIFIMIWYIMLLKGSFVILKWRSQNFMKSQKKKQNKKESIEPKYVRVFPWWHHVGRVPQCFSLYVSIKFARKLFPHSYNEVTLDDKEEFHTEPTLWTR